MRHTLVDGLQYVLQIVIGHYAGHICRKPDDVFIILSNGLTPLATVFYVCAAAKTKLIGHRAFIR